MSFICKNFAKSSSIRFFSRSCFRREANKSVADSSKDPVEMIAVGPREKFFLVWGGKYKSKAEVPDKVRVGEFASARTKCRIKLANYCMAGFVVLALFISFRGKSLAAKGETFAKPSLERHEAWKKQKE